MAASPVGTAHLLPARRHSAAGIASIGFGFVVSLLCLAGRALHPGHPAGPGTRTPFWLASTTLLTAAVVMSLLAVLLAVSALRQRRLHTFTIISLFFNGFLLLFLLQTILF